MGDRTCPVSPTPCAQPYLPRPCLLPAVLASGERLPCDLFVVAAGCKYNLNPSFLKEMKLGRQGWLLNSWKGGAAHSPSAIAASGHAKACPPPFFSPLLARELPPPPSQTPFLPGFADLHSYAFLGRNPRIGTASDFVFAFVPAGPMKQLEMYFHVVDCCKKGLESVRAGVALPCLARLRARVVGDGPGSTVKNNRLRDAQACRQLGPPRPCTSL